MESIPEVSAQIVGANIRLAMETRQIRPTRLAADIDVSESTLRRFTEGTSDPSFRQAIHLAAVLGYPLEWFSVEHAATKEKVA